MARLAWFTPLPPDRSGIADYSAALLPGLAAGHEVDVYTATPRPHPLGGALRVFSAHDFPWRHRRTPYDLAVYQLGNAACHDFIWPHLPRYPGLVVLHDGQLHHARARRLLTRGGEEAYRAEFKYNHPDAPEGVADLVVDALAGSIYYFYPMLRWVLRTARLVAVHSPGLARDLREEHPGVEVVTVRSGVEDPAQGPVWPPAAMIRNRYGVPPEAVLFGAFGLVTPEKRIPAVLRALAALQADAAHPGGGPAQPHLLLAGGTVDHYDPAAEARQLGIAERVHVTGYLPDEELPAHIAACDVCLSLRWPSGRETSAVWLRALAAGKPTLVSDLAHSADTPTLSPRSWQVLPAPLARPGTAPDPVSVSIDLVDEQEELVLAMTRLAADGGLRDDLGRAARAQWAAHHTMETARADYGVAIARALERPSRRIRDLPAHLLPDPLEPARRTAAEWGVDIEFQL